MKPPIKSHLVIEKKTRKAPMRGVATLRYLEAGEKWDPLVTYEYRSALVELKKNKHSNAYRFAYQPLNKLLMELKKQTTDKSGKILIKNGDNDIHEYAGFDSMNEFIKSTCDLAGKTTGFLQTLVDLMIDRQLRAVEIYIEQDEIEN
jgi:hypothetical protein